MNHGAEPSLQDYDYLDAEEFDVSIEGDKPIMLYRPYLGRRALITIAVCVIAAALVPAVGCMIGTTTLTRNTSTATVMLFTGCFLLLWLVPVISLILHIRKCQRGHI